MSYYLPEVEHEVDIIENMFSVIDKNSREDIPFTLNVAQSKFARNMTGRDLIPKARQEGFSTFVLALFTVRCLYKRNTNAVVISHDSDSTERLFRRVKYFLANIKGGKSGDPILPDIGSDSARIITFPKTNSTFYIGTAGSRRFGRGDTITDLHCSEAAYWESDPEGLFSGLSDAVTRTGTIILESTGQGRNWYCTKVMAAAEGKGRYTTHFFNWQDFPEYDLPVTPEEIEHIEATLDSNYEEDILYNNKLLTAGQIKFRREKLEEKNGDLIKFKREYPMTLDECFLASDQSMFQKVTLIPVSHWVQQLTTGRVRFYALSNHPRRDLNYIIGVDSSGGTEQDNAVIQVVCIETMEQVAEWVSDKTAPDDLAGKVMHLGRKYNEAYITVESNNHGLVTLSHMKGKYPSVKIYRDPRVNKMNPLLSMGVNTTKKSKPLMIGVLRTFLAEGLIIHSELLRDELTTFVEKDNNALEALDNCKDDRVMALAACMYGYNKAALLVGEESVYQDDVTPDPFTLDYILDELYSKVEEFPIRPQAAVGDYE